MSYEMNLRRVAMLSAASLAFLGAACGGDRAPLQTKRAKPEATPQEQVKAGEMAIQSCEVPGAEPETVVVTADDLLEDVDVPGAYHYLRTEAFERMIDDMATESDYVSASLMEFDTRGDEICFKDKSDGGLNQEDREALLATVANNKPLINIAARAGMLERIDIRVNEVDPEDVPESPKENAQYLERDATYGEPVPTVRYFVDGSFELHAKGLWAAMRHELLHAITSKMDLTFAQELKDVDRALEFGQACSAIREIAFQQNAVYMGEIADNLQIAASYAKIAQAGVLNEIAEIVRSGTFIDHQAYAGKYDQSYNDEYGLGNVPECTVESPYDMSLRYMDERGVSVGLKYLEDIPEADTALNAAEDIWYDALKQDTIYKLLSESDYLPEMLQTDQERYEHDGHPYNWDEMITSLLNIAITYPNEFIANVKQLPEDQKAAVLQIMDQSVKAIAETYPGEQDFNQYLASIQADLAK